MNLVIFQFSQKVFHWHIREYYICVAFGEKYVVFSTNDFKYFESETPYGIEKTNDTLKVFDVEANKIAEFILPQSMAEKLTILHEKSLNNEENTQSFQAIEYTLRTYLKTKIPEHFI